ncbi:hypothetical protein [Paenibacillus algorifonticola]|uniref:hypothetical protein n=1 Tax=Paenibacillus algorifonticola TaxID=684063 RepID=UPI000619670E|nr:hypothetical protein [Paenibacillus algorifonticola]
MSNSEAYKRIFDEKIRLIKEAIVEIHSIQKQISITAVASYLEINFIHASDYKSIKEMIKRAFSHYFEKTSQATLVRDY